MVQTMRHLNMEHHSIFTNLTHYDPNLFLPIVIRMSIIIEDVLVVKFCPVTKVVHNKVSSEFPYQQQE